MSRLVCLSLLLVVTYARSANADSITYQYIQTAGYVVAPDQTRTPTPNFQVQASLTIDGTFADLPTIFTCSAILFQAPAPLPGCADPAGIVAPLLAISITSPFLITLDTLEPDAVLTQLPFNPTPQVLYFGPGWRLSPTGFDYFALNDSLLMNFLTGDVTALSDGPVAGCYVSTPAANQRCAAEGYWAVTPEPGTMLLVATGGAAAMWRRRRPRG